MKKLRMPNKKLTSLSVVFPAYNDQFSIPLIAKKISKILPQVTDDYEIIIVNDGSEDDTLRVLKELKREYKYLNIVDHKINKGYGAALMSGFRKAKKDYIFYTDGDGQYDVSELIKLVSVIDAKTDLVTGYKINRSDSIVRVVIGTLYRRSIKILLRIKIKDVNCDFRIFRRSLIQDMEFKRTSGAFGAEFFHKLHKKNINFKEVGVNHYPRLYGRSQFFRIDRITRSFVDIGLVRLGL